ncbi:MAG: GFA family protein [Candidatus Competibacteraceae bacterium]|nr:MAG: GFA family protein [Candidatus Competibacteraceae bacterium]
MSEQYFATGQCLCGDIKYTISSAPIRMGQCHCDHCRRLTGTGHSSNAFFAKDTVHIEGETSHYDSIADTGAIITRYFCPKYGSRLFGTSNVATNIISVSAGTLDSSSWFKPNAIVYNKRKPIWDFMDENISTFEEMPPAPTQK